MPHCEVIGETLVNIYPPPVTTSLGFDIRDTTSVRHKSRTARPPTACRKARILVVDNDPTTRRLLCSRLGAANYEVESASSEQAALDACGRTHPNLVIADLHIQQIEGIGFLKQLKSRWPALSVIILTAHGTIPEAVRATQCGAFGYLVKPVGKAELLGQVQRAIAASTSPPAADTWRENIVARSELMEDRLQRATGAAASDSPVLITGESGTGKELFARTIHVASARRDNPFIAVSCQTLPEELLEYCLFGSDKGKSPAASMGAFESARGGTLFLEEIGDLPMRLQARVLQALCGGHEHSDHNGHAPGADVRLMCTTSRDIRQLMEQGLFREDLYYRICVLPIEIPPLGRRREDIPLLISHFLEKAAEEHGLEKVYSAKAVQLLTGSDWPGNVRQLFDVVRQNVKLSREKVMTEAYVQKSLGSGSKQVLSYDDARDEFLREYLTKNLQSTAGNVTESARVAKRNRADFYKLLARYRVLPKDFKK
jgi:two-component system response regulator GlrR